METYIEPFTAYLKDTKKMAANSLAAYRRDVTEFHEYLRESGLVSLAQLSGAEIVSYVMQLKKLGRAPSTLNRKMSSVRAYCYFLYDRKIINDNPSLRIHPPKTEKKELEYLTIEEVEKILEAPDDSAKGLRDRSILEIIYGTGIRVTEVTELRTKDVNFRIGYITCSGEFGKARIIPLGRPCREALERYMDESRPVLIAGARRRSQETEDAGKTDENDYVYVNYHGQKLTRQGLWKIVRRYAQKAGVSKNLTPQILRSSFAVHMVQNGADIKSIQELMGYEDLSTAQIYLSVTKNRIKEVFDRTHPRA